ncbi:MAG: hypothetical protein J1F07_00085 [Muribaculaceae bacterium]|nr:hypothetical protein [Muribaculaceae bacterium]
MKLLVYIWLASFGLLGLVSGSNYRMLCQAMSIATPGIDENLSDFEKAVQIIKKYEGMHQPKHWPLVGYGHKVLPGETFSRTKALSQEKAEEILRKDLLKNCAVFRSYGADSLILGVLAYNIGSGKVLKSTVAKKLKEGERDLYDLYVSYSKYKGKTNSQLKRRRIEEFESLFIKELPSNNSIDPNIEIQETQTVKTEE